MGLTDLDSNNYDKVLSWKNRNADKIPSIEHNSIDTLERDIVVSEFGELEVKRLRQHHKQLTDKEMLEIIGEYQDGKSTYDLAEKYGCHRNTIGRHLKKSGIK